MKNKCSTCKHRRYTPSKTSKLCLVARWWCGLHRKLIGEGHNRDLEAAKGCDKWEKQ